MEQKYKKTTTISYKQYFDLPENYKKQIVFENMCDVIKEIYDKGLVCEDVTFRINNRIINNDRDMTNEIICVIEPIKVNEQVVKVEYQPLPPQRKFWKRVKFAFKYIFTGRV